MPLTAEWIRDRDKFPWELVRASTGTTGLRTYLVNTDLIDKALTAPGLPAIDDPWDGIDYPDLCLQILAGASLDALQGRGATGAQERA